MNEKIQKLISTLKGTKLLKYVSSHPEITTIILIFSLALFLRLLNIAGIPAGFSEKERETVNQIANINRNRAWLGSEFYKASYLYPAWLWIKIFGLKIINLRIFSAILGSLTVLFTYIFISKWFSKKIAIFSAFLFAISAFHITLSRLILPEIVLPLVTLIIFSLLTDAYRTKNIWYFGLAGFFTGIGFYTSPAFLFVPILFVISGIYFYLKNKKFLTSYKKEIGISGLAFLASSLPFWVSFFGAPMAYLTYFGFNRSLWQVILNIGEITNMLFLGTSPNYFYNLGTEPLLDPFIFITAIAGFLLALFAIQRRKYFFLIMWLVIFSIYAAMKRGVQMSDLIGILPPLYAFSALILDYILEKWFTTFPLNKRARTLVVIIISALFALSGLYNYERYFVAYKNSFEAKKEFSVQPPIPLK
jgi:4-amino-4-deoxy-L-arabinose transferase-like glycosyltransferase